MFITRVCQALNQAKVSYALVGGHAVALHGAVRGTIDIDICIAFSKKDFEAFARVAAGLGLQSRLPVTAQDVFQFRQEYIKNRNLIAWSFYDPANPVNVVDIIITHDAAKMKKVTKTIGQTKIYVAAKADLIAMKQASGRPQDLADIEALKKI